MMIHTILNLTWRFTNDSWKIQRSKDPYSSQWSGTEWRTWQYFLHPRYSSIPHLQPSTSVQLPPLLLYNFQGYLSTTLSYSKFAVGSRISISLSCFISFLLSPYSFSFRCSLSIRLLLGVVYLMPVVWYLTLWILSNHETFRICSVCWLRLQSLRSFEIDKQLLSPLVRTKQSHRGDCYRILHVQWQIMHNLHLALESSMERNGRCILLIQYAENLPRMTWFNTISEVTE